MISIHDLHAYAHTLGVTLTHHNDGPKGWYSHALKLLSTRRGLSVAEYKSTLAHELAHAHYGDSRCSNPHFHRRQERRADEWAARVLLTKSDVDDWAGFHAGNCAALANELEVSQHMLKTWMKITGYRFDLETHVA